MRFQLRGVYRYTEGDALYSVEVRVVATADLARQMPQPVRLALLKDVGQVVTLRFEVSRLGKKLAPGKDGRTLWSVCYVSVFDDKQLQNGERFRLAVPLPSQEVSAPRRGASQSRSSGAARPNLPLRGPCFIFPSADFEAFKEDLARGNIQVVPPVRG